MFGCVFLAADFLGGGLVLHRAGDGEFGGFVVVFEDFFVVLGVPMDEHAADDAEFFALVLGNHALFDRIGDRLGDRELCGAEHLHGLLGAFDRDLGHQHRGRFDGQVRFEHRQQIAVSLALPRQGVGERCANGTILFANQQIDMGDFIALAHQRFANMHRHFDSPENVSFSCRGLCPPSGERQFIASLLADGRIS